MKKFCELLKEDTMKIINFKTKKESYSQKSSRNHLKICKKQFENKYVKDKKYR